MQRVATEGSDTGTFWIRNSRDYWFPKKHDCLSFERRHIV